MKIWKKTFSELTVRDYTLWAGIVWLVSFMIGFAILFFDVYEKVAEWFVKLRNKISG